jgi:hypothetical protein
MQITVILFDLICILFCRVIADWLGIKYSFTIYHQCLMHSLYQGLIIRLQDYLLLQ